VFVPFHWAEFNANQVTQSAFDPISREPNYKQSAVRVERSPVTGYFDRRRHRRATETP
jgi:assimilatory nitrate reductase catalytic subunit